MVNHVQVPETKKEVRNRGEEKVKRRDCYNHSALLQHRALPAGLL